MSLNRRQFLHAAAIAGATAAAGCHAPRVSRRVSPSEKLNLGVVGVAGRGGENLAGVSSQNIVALCDIDSERLGAAAAKHPGAAQYADYRRLLDRSDLDGIVVSTPDHSHAVIATAVLASGRNLYCEKPVTHTISEARALPRRSPVPAG
ncbi:MAG: Gfo/Idh/MocA family protein [Verrucomicrobiota bacterium]